MADRPSLDDLKQARDGQTSAGRPAPSCYRCGEAFTAGENRTIAHIDGIDRETGHRYGRTVYFHADCIPGRGDG